MPVAGVTEQLHYIGDKALFVKKLGADHHEYLHRDHIGSIVAISGDSLNSSADAQFLSNGAWGERRMAQWNGPLDPGVIPSSTAHGFTDHEHLDAVGLIHMKGRVYDPELGRFLSADPHVQAPFNSQSYNRYAYVFNNPLSFTDPSGYTAVEIVVIGYPDDGGSAGGFTTGGNTGGDTGTAGGGGEQTVDLSSVREFIPDARIDPGVMLEQQWMKMDELNSKQGINSLTDLVVGFLDPSEGARECKDKGCGGGGWAMAVAGMFPIGKAGKLGASSLDILNIAGKTKSGFKVDNSTLQIIGASEAKGGKGFSGLIAKVVQDKPATWAGKEAGGTQTVIKYQNSAGQTQFTLHTVTDGTGNVVHRDFDSVLIQSGQQVVK